MRCSHMYSITICRCGIDVINTMMDDYTLRSMLPCRLLDDYDKSQCYRRIFNREGAIDGNCLCLDTPFLDAIRSYISHGGDSKNTICPNIIIIQSQM